MVGEVRLAQDKQARHGAHQVVINPQPAHRIMQRGINPHRHFVCILAGDRLVHVEQIAVPLFDRTDAEPLDRVGEIEIYTLAPRAHAAAFIADLFGGA
jgi:hypothetical protein